MINIELCLQNKIANSSKLRPTILMAILNLYNSGKSKMTAEMVKNECLVLDISKPWNDRIPAICLSMKNATECGGRIIGEDRDFLGFTIEFDGIGNSLEIETPKKTSQKVELKKKEKPNISDKPSKMNLKIELENLGLSKNFKLVMICADKKNVSSFDEYPFENFVNNIALPPLSPSEHHPDAPMTSEKITWRDYLINHQNDNNLLEAYNLYKRNEYRCLHRKYKNNFYILSAGWGLVNSEFKLPNYNITFSNNTKQRNKRSKNINSAPFYKDFNKFYDESKKLLINPKEDILYIGGKDYLELFYDLTQNLPNRKIIFKFNNTDIPAPPNDSFLIRSYLINYPSFWYYQLAKDLYNL